MSLIQKKRKCTKAKTLESKYFEQNNETLVEKKSDTPFTNSAAEENDQHPLLNSVVLMRILDFRQPDLEELKTIRLVCRTWHEITMTAWRTTAVIKLVPDAPFFNRRSFKEITVTDYFNEIKNEDSCYQLARQPYKRYKFISMTIDTSFCDEDGNSKLFWEMIGPFAEYAHFEKCTFVKSLHMDKPFVQLLVRKLPNLVHLALTDLSSCEASMTLEEINEMNKLSTAKKCKTFRKCHPKLTTLTVHGNVDVDLCSLFALTPKLTSIIGINGKENRQITDAVKKVAKGDGKAKKMKNKLPNLKHLDLMKTRPFPSLRDFRSQMNSLVQANLKLETFMVTLPQESPHAFYHNIPVGHPDAGIDSVLSSMSGTLQVLKVFRGPFSYPFSDFLTETKMSAIRELHLWGNVAVNYHFLKCTPNLEVLYINLGCFEKREEIKSIISGPNAYSSQSYKRPRGNMAMLICWSYMGTQTVIHKLSKLHVDYAFPEQSLDLMAVWMPNLKSLKTILKTYTVPVVCKRWRELTELVCLFGSKLENFNFLCKDNRKFKRSGTATFGNLKKLERFQLDSLCGKSKLSDTCVFRGLLKMPSLKSVQICVSKKMSTRAEKYLNRRFGSNCRVIRNYSGGDHSNYDCCQRVQFNDECASNFRRLRRGETEEEAVDCSESSSSDSDSE